MRNLLSLVLFLFSLPALAASPAVRHVTVTHTEARKAMNGEVVEYVSYAADGTRLLSVGPNLAMDASVLDYPGVLVRFTQDGNLVEKFTRLDHRTTHDYVQALQRGGDVTIVMGAEGDSLEFAN